MDVVSVMCQVAGNRYPHYHSRCLETVSGNRYIFTRDEQDLEEKKLQLQLMTGLLC
jgi:hypothetical protein